MPETGTDKWDTEVFSTVLDGVNSYLEPNLIPQSQNAWQLNAVIRGGMTKTRPPIRSLGYLPEGLIQGAGYFSIQDGMIVVSIGGRIYRLRIGPHTEFTAEEIPLSFPNSPVLQEAWFCETVGSLLIQDGQSDCIIYDGNVARRSDTSENEVPLGRQMAYGNGRLWVAVAGNQLVAGDIVTDVFQSELFFTENTYLFGGGSLSFPTDIRGLQFSPMANTMEQGPLCVFGQAYTKTVRADITNRDLWAQIPAFVISSLRNIGAAGQKCITPVNQDLYWRDDDGAIRSLSSALASQSDPAATPLSGEVSRIVNYEATRKLTTSSSTYFDNRLLTLASPFINPKGGISFKNIISLDFAPISTMRAKAPPAYDGVWSGAQFTQLVTGKFGGRERCFGISSDSDGNNRLWEIHKKGVADTSEAGTSPIVGYLETPRRNWGTPKRKKKLARLDVYLTDIEGEIEVKAYWRPDNQQKWMLWDEGATACALMEDADQTTVPHVWKNLASQYRPQVKTFTIPTEISENTKYSISDGFEHQFRVTWTGHCRILRVLAHATIFGDETQALRDLLPTGCTYNDITGNSIFYTIPIRVRPGQILTTEDGVDLETESGFLLGTG